MDTSPTWLQIVFGLIATFLGGGASAKLASIYLNRKKPAADIHESIARARKINIDGDVEQAAIIDRLYERIDRMQIGIDTLRNERNDFELQVKQAGTQAELDNMWIVRLTAANKLGIKLSDLDLPQHKKDRSR